MCFEIVVTITATKDTATGKWNVTVRASEYSTKHEYNFCVDDLDDLPPLVRDQMKGHFDLEKIIYTEMEDNDPYDEEESEEEWGIRFEFRQKVIQAVERALQVKEE